MGIAEAPLAVDHADLDIAAQAIMLQAVIGEDQIAARLDEKLRRFRTFATDRHRNAALPDQAGLVAHYGGIVVARPEIRSAFAAAVTAADDARNETALLQRFRQGDDQGCLAGAADGDVADDHDRHRKAYDARRITAKALGATTDDVAIERLERQRPPRRG